MAFSAKMNRKIKTYLCGNNGLWWKNSVNNYNVHVIPNFYKILTFELAKWRLKIVVYWKR
jgi:hypothetical protein